MALEVADGKVDGDDFVGSELDGEQGLFIFLVVVHVLLPSSLFPGAGDRDTWAALQEALKGHWLDLCVISNFSTPPHPGDDLHISDLKKLKFFQIRNMRKRGFADFVKIWDNS